VGADNLSGGDEIMRIAVFVSGRGSNLRALWKAIQTGRLPATLACVVADRSCPALQWAREQGIEAHLVPFDPTPDVFAEALLSVLRACRVEAIVLAGFLRLLPPAVIRAYENRILNVHPALLPAFGGRGFYGLRVHEAVLRSGVRWSGATVHLVTEDYDAGPIVAQEVVPVLPDDTPETLQARVQQAEHRLLARAVRWLLEGRLELEGGRVRIRMNGAGEREEEVRIRRALLSVSDKTGLLELARGLQELGVELLSTGGTARLLEEAGLQVTRLEAYTGWPEMLGGRVKTLHPRVHGGILARRDVPEDLQALEQWGIEPIDLVVINLYPFREAAADPARTHQEVIEQIDIGGPAMVRAAAKNCRWVAVLTDPAQYPEVLHELRARQGRLSLQTRTRLAREAFTHTAAYEAAIAEYVRRRDPEYWPSWWIEAQPLQAVLRYGENPHQRAAFYGALAPAIEVLHGRALSYNNLLDIEAALRLAGDFSEDRALCAILKHTNPCGVALGESSLEAWERAFQTDRQAPFGGIVIFNRVLDQATALAVDGLFTEILLAPDFEPGALEVLMRKPNRRLVRWRPVPGPDRELRSVLGGLLVQEPDRDGTSTEAWRLCTEQVPTETEWRDLVFAWRVVRHVKSNAIVLARGEATIGIGAGQMSRVDAVRLAIWKAQEAGFDTRGAVAASEAFFPFSDSVEILARAGVRAVVQPGGSVRDPEVIEAANRLGVAMVFTGKRHFRH
jgi:phosphoribosylaminoimidazolecarboxamide formyltransferase/IMP cyclohydrolase